MSHLNDLLEDLEFVRWVKYPDPKLNVFWERWMEANPDQIRQVKLAREIILGIQFPPHKASPETKKKVLNRILQTKGEPVEMNLATTSIKKYGRVGEWKLIRAAAVFTGIILLSALLYNLYVRNEPEQPPLTSSNWTTKSTNSGEKLSFRLPDQTVVWLNSGSSLSFPHSFDSTVRLVRLKGEGFFEVAENALQPFQVLSDDLITTALGTSFNVNSKKEGEIKVALISGKVSIKYGEGNLDYFLKPGEELTYEISSNKVRVSEFSSEQVLAWRAGTLIFKRATHQEVMKTLQEWYGVEIILFGSPKKEWRFNGKFENQTLDNVLKSLSNIEDFNYSLENKKVEIKFNP
jgi:transmembrane sensor